MASLTSIIAQSVMLLAVAIILRRFTRTIRQTQVTKLNVKRMVCHWIMLVPFFIAILALLVVNLLYAFHVIDTYMSLLIVSGILAVTGLLRSILDFFLQIVVHLIIKANGVA